VRSRRSAKIHETSKQGKMVLKGDEARFGIFVGGATHVGVIPDMVVAAERLGYDSFWVSDHLFLPSVFYEAVGMDPGKGECAVLEAWTTLSAAAAVTKKIMLGVGVTPLPLRDPAILAKQVATIDYISGGRVILGAGAGWNRREFEAYGIRWDSHPVRIAKMLEGLEVIKRLWTQPFASYQGRYYKLREAPLWPKPIQKPHPPIWFGGTSQSIMEATVQYGDGWVPYCPTAEEFKEKFSKLENLIEKAGRHVREIVPACVLLAHIASDLNEARAAIESIIKLRGSRTLKPERWEDAKETIVYGGADDCISKIEEYLKIGVKHILLEMVIPEEALNCIKLFGERVLPYFKQQRR